MCKNRQHYTKYLGYIFLVNLIEQFIYKKSSIVVNSQMIDEKLLTQLYQLTILLAVKPGID